MITSIVSPKYQGPPFHPGREQAGRRRACMRTLGVLWRRRGSQDSYPGTKTPVTLDRPNNLQRNRLP